MTMLMSTGPRVIYQPPPLFYVDSEGVGGVASDAYSIQQALNPATPWASIAKAWASVPGGSEIVVRGSSADPSISADHPDLIRMSNLKKAAPVTLRPAEGEAVFLPEVQLPGGENLHFEGVDLGVVAFETSAGVRVAASNIALRDLKLRSCDVPSSSQVDFERVEFAGTIPHNGRSFGLNYGNDVVLRLIDVDIHTYTENVHGGRFAYIYAENVRIFDTHVDLDDPWPAELGEKPHPDGWQFVYTGLAGKLVVRGLHIFNNSAQGAFWNCAVGEVDIENMLVAAGLGSGMEMDLFSGGSAGVIKHLTVDGSIRAGSGAMDLEVYNSIVRPIRNQTAIDAGLQLSPWTAEKGNIWRTGKPASMGAMDPTSVSGTPTFVDPANQDYRLTSGSVGKGVGLNAIAGVPLPAHDRLGRVRTGARDPGSDQS